MGVLQFVTFLSSPLASLTVFTLCLSPANATPHTRCGTHLDHESRRAVDVALHRLARKGAIRRFTRGMYNSPKKYSVLGLLSPFADSITQALVGRDRTRLQPAGTCAAKTTILKSSQESLRSSI